MWRCESSDSDSDTCPAGPRFLSHHSGFATGDQCTETVGDATDCALRCASRPRCKLVKQPSCAGGDGACTCEYCEQVTAINFTSQSDKFYLNIMEIAADVSEASLPGGLALGQPLLLKVVLKGIETVVSFSTAAGQTRLHTVFKYPDNVVKTESRLADGWRMEDSSPYTYLNLQEISMLYIFTSTAILLYIDQVFFHEIPQRYPLQELELLLISTR